MAIAPLNSLNPGPINDLLLDVVLIHHILPYFSPLELAEKCMLVSRTWNRCAADPFLWPASKLTALNCSVLDESVWREHAPLIVDAQGISFEGIGPLDLRLAIIKVTRYYDRLKKAGTSIEGDAGVAILTIPQGVSINRVYTVFQERCRDVWVRILSKLGGAKVDQAYQIIISRNVLQGSRDKSIQDQRALVERVGCVLPKVLEAMTLALLTEKSTSGKIRLFGMNPWAYTSCIEVLELPLIVGSFGMLGLHVSDYCDDKDVGAAARRLF